MRPKGHVNAIQVHVNVIQGSRQCDPRVTSTTETITMSRRWIARSHMRRSIAMLHFARFGSLTGTSLIDLVVDASVAFKWLIPESAEEDVPTARCALSVRHLL